MRFQLGIQVLLLVIAIVIAFSVIKPKFAEISLNQNEVVSHRDALDNIGRYNQRLQTLINQANSLPASDRAALLRYLPESIDFTAVSRDITNIVEHNRLLLLDISFDQLRPITTITQQEGILIDPATQYADPQNDMGSSPIGLYAQRMTVSVAGTYGQMKAMLQDFERNSYPLRLVEFEFTSEEASSQLVQYSFVLETYSLPTSIPNTNI